jgi:subfamily B ATP-binding cassette protein HlyB/CyaB
MPKPLDQKPKLDTGLICLALMAQFHETPINADQLKHEFTGNTQLFSTQEMLLAIKHIGLKAKQVSDINWERLQRIPLPAIAQAKDGSYFIVAKISEDKVLIHNPKTNKPSTLQKATFLKKWDQSLILMTRRALLNNALRRFDFSWFIPEIVKYRKLFSEVLVASFFLQLFGLVTPLFFQVTVDKVLVHHSFTTLDVLVFGFIVISLFETLMGALRTYILTHTTSRIDVTLGARLFKHMLSLPIAYFENRRVGDVVARVRELETIRNFLTGSALTAALDAFFIVVFLAVMFYYAPLLTWIVIGSIPFYVALSVFITPVLRGRMEEKFTRGAENQAFLVENITGSQTIKSSSLEPQMRRRWDELLSAYVKAGFKANNLNNVASQFAQLISKITMALTLWFGAHMVINGELTVGMLVAFNMLTGRVTGPILRLAQLWQEFQQVGVSIERLGDVLNAKSELTNKAQKARMPNIEGKVTFEHVTFRYQPDMPAVLDDINLEVKPGETIGIVGASGSGKSTLTKLVQRLYVPEKGRTLIDGMDIGLVDPTWLRRQVGVVLQENFLFNRSIQDNIAISDPALSMEKIIEAAKLAGAHEFITALPEGYETILVERGSNLSGGQRQRIAIARALVTQPQILILDEATSALDYESESIIQKNMREICKGRTVFIIAHRLSTVYDANRIIVMDKGRIVEEGTHKSLIAKEMGHYARLYRLQSEGSSAA